MDELKVERGTDTADPDECVLSDEQLEPSLSL